LVEVVDFVEWVGCMFVWVGWDGVVCGVVVVVDIVKFIFV